MREAEALAQKKNEPARRKPAPRIEPEVSPQLVLNQDRLRDCFATKVMIKPQGERGKIELEYYSREDFNRIYALLIK